MQKLINVLVTYPESYPHVVEKCFLPEMHSRNILRSTKSRNHSLLFLSTVLYSSASEVDRRQKESVVIGRQSNVVETSASESKRLWRGKKRCLRFLGHKNMHSVAYKCEEILYMLIINCNLFEMEKCCASRWQNFDFLFN